MRARVCVDSCVYRITIYKKKKLHKISLGYVEIQKYAVAVALLLTLMSKRQVHRSTSFSMNTHVQGGPSTQHPDTARQISLGAPHAWAGCLARPSGAASVDKASNYLRTKMPRAPCGRCASMGCQASGPPHCVSPSCRLKDMC